MLRTICAARLAERANVGRELLDLAGAVHSEAVRGDRGPELRVGRDCRVPNAVDRIERVANSDRVQTTPLPGREHPGVDLQMQMTMRIARAAGVVPHCDRLEVLDWHLHLMASRPDAGGRVLGEPTDNLRRGAVLCGVIGGSDVRV